LGGGGGGGGEFFFFLCGGGWESFFFFWGGGRGRGGVVFSSCRRPPPDRENKQNNSLFSPRTGPTFPSSRKQKTAERENSGERATNPLLFTVKKGGKNGRGQLLSQSIGAGRKKNGWETPGGPARKKKGGKKRGCAPSVAFRFRKRPCYLALGGGGGKRKGERLGLSFLGLSE